jgi:hypothetical protein
MSTSNGRARSSGAANRPNSRSGKPAAVSRPGLSNNAEKRQIVGQYMLGKTIGEGTFGKVKLAIHVPTGEKVLKLSLSPHHVLAVCLRLL